MSAENHPSVASSVQATILDCEERLLTALQSQDLAALDALLHEDLLFNIPNGQTVIKAMDLEAHRSGIMKIQSIAAQAPSVNVIDDTAVVAVTVAMKGSFQGQPLDGSFRYLRVWKLCDGRWQVIAGSCVGV